MTTASNSTTKAPADLEAEEKHRSLTPEERNCMLEDLEQRQLELEMQNKALRRAQEELQALKDRYFDLYDLAPVGYLDIDEDGLILEANLTAAGLLGMAKQQLINRPLSRYILPTSEDDYHIHRRRLFASGEAQTCELRMRRGDGSQFWASLHASPAPPMQIADNPTATPP
jgi:PAS domain S-box-containing protein